MVAALQYLPEGTDPEVLGYWAPDSHHRGQRLLRDSRPLGAARAGPRVHRLPARPGQRPAELRVRRLPAGVSTSPTAEELVAASWSPSTCGTLVSDDEVSGGYRLDALAPDVEKLWEDAYSDDHGWLRWPGASGSKADPQRLWAALDAAWHRLAGRPLRRSLLRHRRDRVRRVRPDPGSAVAPLEPADLAVHRRSTTSSTEIVTGSLAQRDRAHLRLRGDRTALCFVIGYPVAYYVARHAGERRLFLLAAHPAVLDELPDADAGLGQPPQPGRRLGGECAERRRTRPASSISSASATAGRSGSPNRSP